MLALNINCGGMPRWPWSWSSVFNMFSCYPAPRGGCLPCQHAHAIKFGRNADCVFLRLPTGTATAQRTGRSSCRLAKRVKMPRPRSPNRCSKCRQAADSAKHATSYNIMPYYANACQVFGCTTRHYATPHPHTLAFDQLRQCTTMFHYASRHDLHVK